MIVELAFVMALSQGGNPAAARELTRIEQRIANTWKAGDCSAWAAMLAPEWSVIHITGDIMTKAAALEACKSPRTPGEDLTLDDLSVRLFGDAAVVTGRTTVTSGAGPALTLRFTDVFVRREGRWQVVASHATRVGS
jgi:ketosteroid isomerase-like protein